LINEFTNNGIVLLDEQYFGGSSKDLIIAKVNNFIYYIFKEIGK
jgi:hypothetical protein